MATEPKKKLGADDWKALLQVEEFKLGETTLDLRPVNLIETNKILGMIEASKEELIASNITAENYTDPAQLLVLTKMLMDKVPDIISDCANLEIDDVHNLPLVVATRLVAKLVKVNISSKDELIKNFTALAEGVQEMMTVEESETSHNSLSVQDTNGQTSKNTPSEK